MTSATDLEIEGNFFSHPFAELLVEIADAGLNGSLRVNDKDRKVVVYFKRGRVVFAVSNARSSRLFHMLLSRGRLKTADLTQIPNFQQDFELAAFLKDNGFLTPSECERLLSEQIEGILVDVLAWPSGNWTFTSLARIRDGLDYPVDTRRLMLDYARTVPVEAMLTRFRSLDEKFLRSDVPETDVALKPVEAFVLSRSGEMELSAADISRMAAVPETTALHLIYALWLAGLLTRRDWQPAFSGDSITAMTTARLELKKEATVFASAGRVDPTEVEIKREEEVAPVPEPELSLEDYLTRVETAETYYDTLSVDTSATAAEIKKAYFGLAKVFHPDKFHSEGGEVLQRVQNAFTELAQAHETLKTAESRELYDFRVRKELAARKKHGAGDLSMQVEQAAQSFEAGFTLLMDDQAEAAIPLLARSVHYAPKNARYRAYYGKALSSDPKERFKAEAEIQAAIKLDPENATFRLLLAEFFIQFKLAKRAEGELNRLLAIFPSNREARSLLATIRG